MKQSLIFIRSGEIFTFTAILSKKTVDGICKNCYGCHANALVSTKVAGSGKGTRGTRVCATLTRSKPLWVPDPQIVPAEVTPSVSIIQLPGTAAFGRRIAVEEIFFYASQTSATPIWRDPFLCWSPGCFRLLFCVPQGRRAGSWVRRCHTPRQNRGRQR